MGKRDDIKRILVVGWGGIIIGEGGEFEYGGREGCLGLKEEG